MAPWRSSGVLQVSRFQIDLKWNYFHPFQAEIFTVAAKGKTLVHTPSEVVHYLDYVDGVSSVFSNQFAVLVHHEAWITLTMGWIFSFKNTFVTYNILEVLVL